MNRIDFCVVLFLQPNAVTLVGLSWISHNNDSTWDIIASPSSRIDWEWRQQLNVPLRHDGVGRNFRKQQQQQQQQRQRWQRERQSSARDGTTHSNDLSHLTLDTKAHSLFTSTVPSLICNGLNVWYIFRSRHAKKDGCTLIRMSVAGFVVELS